MSPYAFWFAGDANGNLEAVHGGSRSKPGMIGARGSRMGKALLNATHQKALTDGTFSETDMRTLTQWLDLGSDELGHCDNEAGQKRGELVWPSLDLDKNDPQGTALNVVTNTTTNTSTSTATSTRLDAGTTSPDAPQTKNDASPSATGGTTSSSATGGVVANGGQTQPASTGGAGGTGGNTAKGGSPAGGGQTASSGGASAGGMANNGGQGSGGGEVASGGKSASGGSKTTPIDTSKGGGCAMGTKASATAPAWILSILGIALFMRKRRR
jgi:hypothetical protein